MSSENKKKEGIVPEPSLRRMPCYLAYLKLAKRRNQEYVSSTHIARDMGVDPTQVTKDLSYTSIVGKTRVGYEVNTLIDVLEDFLGFRKLDKAYLFGAGSLGNALLHDHGLDQYGLKIVAAFDIDPKVVGRTIEGVPILHVSEFEKMKDKNVEVGILTVPAEFAQDVAQQMARGGIKGIWNFTPIRIRLAEDCVVQDTSLYAHLAVMFNRMSNIKK
ncbi:redox-sensing transcriptional repressor Rex [Plebeiibacterium sediminum]|uniref:Redox-sensing transcriptional repressor Rex n=1 Tax=Plebeiibacterium sediminum TaxID=2992112 RepID=A0AAE3M5V6_9BACT|nr:redox-sensing transcriptional repressor Rex [Plebeiobacterium sediminum]MCW3787826.1 redox-sensing transcriptional repressor Rex [Plebeiobacterium sediminum]